MIGRSQEYVTKRIQLLGLPKNIIMDIISGRISPTTALELLPLNSPQIQALNEIIHNSHLSKNQVRQIIKGSKNMKINNSTDTHEYDIKSRGETDRAFRRAITVLKSNLIRWDDIIRNLDDDWLLREIFLEYRIIIHGDIDTFLKLRKRMKRLNHLYIENDGLSSCARKKHQKVNGDRVNTIPVWTPRTH
ncbi:MAG: hypothetical protein ACRD8Z_17335, partial [Nitrososphaeraceae archaeon]